MVTETDVNLAKASNAVLIAFNVKPSKEAKKIAEQSAVKISSFNIIYELIDFVKSKMSGLLSPDIEESITGSAEILEIFKVSGASSPSILSSLPSSFLIVSPSTNVWPPLSWIAVAIGLNNFGIFINAYFSLADPKSIPETASGKIVFKNPGGETK